MEEKQKFGTGGKRVGAGRKAIDPSGRMKYIQITLPENMIKYAKAQRGGASAFIRSAVEKYIKETGDAPITPAQLLPDPPVPLDDADQAWGRESARKLGYTESKEQ